MVQQGAGTDDPGPGVRLQRVLASAGIGSRRHCEQLIEQGRVSVDGQVVRRQGVRVDPEDAVVRVDGERVPVRPGTTWLALNKPRGILTALSDARGRPCVGDLLAGRRERLFHVGRLDLDSEGLLLLTNDGETANRLTHPRFEVPRRYLVEVAGPLGRGALAQLRRGVDLDGNLVTVARAVSVGQVEGRVLVEVTVLEGRKHLVRRLFEEVGHPVLRLVRTSYGPVLLAGLKPGRTRVLTGAELQALYQLVDSDQPLDQPLRRSRSGSRKAAQRSVHTVVKR